MRLTITPTAYPIAIDWIHAAYKCKNTIICRQGGSSVSMIHSVIHTIRSNRIARYLIIGQVVGVRFS